MADTNKNISRYQCIHHGNEEVIMLSRSHDLIEHLSTKSSHQQICSDVTHDDAFNRRAAVQKAYLFTLQCGKIFTPKLYKAVHLLKLGLPLPKWFLADPLLHNKK